MSLDDFINGEGLGDTECRFLALYVGLRMYKDARLKKHTDLSQFPVAAAEAYCMIEQLKELYPQMATESEIEYIKTYENSN